MFQGITVARDRQERGRTRLPMDKALLGVEWRFLALPDDEPGFSTAWLQPRSLERLANRREREYQHGIMAGFAKEFGMTNLLTSTSGRLDEGEGVGLEQGDEGGERGGFEHAGSPKLTSHDGVDGRSLERSHAMSRQYLGRTGAQNTPTLISALKKGGVHFPLPDGDTRHTEDTGEWDGVDLASAPCLQSYVVGNIASSKPSGLRSSWKEDSAESTDATLSADAHSRKSNCLREAEHAQPRASTPPALLVFKPCGSIKIAEDVPLELQTMPRISMARTNRPSQAGLSTPQAEGEDLDGSALASLKIGVRVEQVSPACPKDPRPSKQSGRPTRKRTAEISSELSCRPRFRHAVPPTPQTFRPSPYGKAWYVDPDLWGVECSPEVDMVDLNQDNTSEGAKQLAHAREIKAAIPSLFSATRFVSYIRQQGLRMPAHLESTERAMEAEKARAGQARRARRIRHDQAESALEDENKDDVSQRRKRNEADTGGKNAPETTQTRPQNKWRAAMALRKRGKRNVLRNKGTDEPAGVEAGKQESPQHIEQRGMNRVDAVRG